MLDGMNIFKFLLSQQITFFILPREKVVGCTKKKLNP